MKKKILVFSLIFTLLCSNNVNADASWFKRDQENNIENICEKKNKCGEIEDLDCAINYLKSALVATGYNEFTQVGKKCEYNLHMWDYNHLHNFPKEIGELLKDAQNGYLQNSAVVNATNEISGLFNIDKNLSRKVLLKFLVDSEYNNLSEKQLDELITNIIQDMMEDYGASNTVGFAGGVAGGIAAGSIGYKVLVAGSIAAKTLTTKVMAVAVGGTAGLAALGFIGIGGLCKFAVDWWKISNKNEEMKTQQIKIKNYSSALEQLLTNLRKGKWKNADSVLAQLNFDPNFYKAVVTMVNSDIKYSEQEKIEFKKDFKDIESELEEMINKNKPKKEGEL